jgi:hypothetical protein
MRFQHPQKNALFFDLIVPPLFIMVLAAVVALIDLLNTTPSHGLTLPFLLLILLLMIGLPIAFLICGIYALFYYYFQKKSVFLCIAIAYLVIVFAIVYLSFSSTFFHPLV